MAVKVQWPDASRLVPFKTKSLKIVIDWVEGGKTTLVDTKVVDRPDPLKTTVTETVFNLKSGSRYRLTVTAHPNAGGVGTALARHVSAANLAIKVGAVNQWPVTMASTVHTLSIEPALTNIDVGDKQVVSVVAKDSSGATVLLAYSSINWTIGSPSVLRAERNVQGLADNQIELQGLLEGSSTLAVRDDESGRSSPVLQIVVSLANTLTISPQNVQVGSAQTRQFQASGGTAPYTYRISDARAGAIDSQTGSFTSQLHMREATITVRDSKGLEANTQVVVTDSLIFFGPQTNFAYSFTGGSISATGDGRNWRVSAPIGEHELSVTNNNEMALNISMQTYSYFGWSSFVFADNNSNVVNFWILAGETVKVRLRRIN